MVHYAIDGVPHTAFMPCAYSLGAFLGWLEGLGGGLE